MIVGYLLVIHMSLSLCQLEHPYLLRLQFCYGKVCVCVCVRGWDCVCAYVWVCFWRHTQTKAEDYVATSHANLCHRNVLALSPARTGHIIYMYIKYMYCCCIQSVSYSVSESIAYTAIHSHVECPQWAPLLLGRTIKRWGQ